MLQKLGACPTTHTHRTPSGGRHLLFRWRPDRPVSNSEGMLKGTGINIRGNGGYVVAPSSQRSDGKAYELEDIQHFFSFAAAPAWLYPLILPSAPSPSLSEQARSRIRPPKLTVASAARKIEGVVGAVASASVGDRNKLLFWGSCRLAEMAEQSFLLTSDAYQLAIESGLQAGLPQREVVRSVRSAFGAATK